MELKEYEILKGPAAGKTCKGTESWAKSGLNEGVLRLKEEKHTEETKELKSKPETKHRKRVPRNHKN